MMELWGRGWYLAVAEYYMLLALWSLLSVIIKRATEQNNNKEPSPFKPIPTIIILFTILLDVPFLFTLMKG